jgi:hypothetical protein
MLVIVILRRTTRDEKDMAHISARSPWNVLVKMCFREPGSTAIA